MILFRATNLVEMTGVPEFYCDDIGQIAVCGPNMKVVFCGTTEISGRSLLYPKCELIRPLRTVVAHVEQIQRALRERSNEELYRAELPFH